MVALDVWMVMSLVFIILPMFETVCVAWINQKGEQNKNSVRDVTCVLYYYN